MTIYRMRHYTLAIIHYTEADLFTALHPTIQRELQPAENRRPSEKDPSRRY